MKKKLLLGLVATSLLLGTLWYVLWGKTYYTVLPVGLKLNGTPFVNVKIGNAFYKMQVDLGSRLEMEVLPEALKKLNCTPHGTESFKNFRGREFVQATYQLPEVRLGSLVFQNPIAVESPRIEENTLWDDSHAKTRPDPDIGSIGRGLLKKVNLLLDMPNSKIILTNDRRKLHGEGYDLSSFVKVPFTLDPKGLLFEVKTDLGRLRLLLDTGSTITILHDALRPKSANKVAHGLPVYTSHVFQLGEVDFGALDLYFIAMEKELYVIDGILGMDFIAKHVIYIDISESIAYVGTKANL